jgi:PAS domain S-box-containing protein
MTDAESQARLRALADNLPHAMVYQIEAAADGRTRRFSFVGASCLRLNGVMPEAVMADARVLYDQIAPEDRSRLAAAEEAAIRNEGPFDIEVGFVHPDGARRWYRLSSAPRPQPDGSVLWDGIQLDVTESRVARDALATEQERLGLVVEATGLGLWDYDVTAGALVWDDRVRALHGMPPGAPVDYERYVAGLHPEDRNAVIGAYADALASGASGYQVEHRTVGEDGAVRWVLGCARILRDPAGTPVRVIGSLLDLTERKRAEEHLQLMVHELNHRVKNSLAVVQAIARRTLHAGGVSAEISESLGSRLLALAQAHDLLTAESWAGADLAAVAARTLDAFGVHRRVRAEGPPVRLQPSAAVTLSLVFHELAVNAIKYGALSRDSGRVEIGWSLEPPGQLRLEWRERGGPPVRKPNRLGFGAQLIERGAAAELGGRATLEYHPDGLICVLVGSV